MFPMVHVPSDNFHEMTLSQWRSACKKKNGFQRARPLALGFGDAQFPTKNAASQPGEAAKNFYARHLSASGVCRVGYAGRWLVLNGAVISSNHGWSWIASANFLMRKYTVLWPIPCRLA